MVALPKIAHQSSRRRLRLPSNSPPSVARCSCSIFCVLSSSVLQGWLNALLHLPLVYTLLHSRRLHPPARQSLDMLYPPSSFPLHTSLHSRSAFPNGFSPLVSSAAWPCGRWGGRWKRSPSFARMLYARAFCCNAGNIPAFLVVFPPSTVSASGRGPTVALPSHGYWTHNTRTSGCDQHGTGTNRLTLYRRSMYRQRSDARC